MNLSQVNWASGISPNAFFLFFFIFKKTTESSSIVWIADKYILGFAFVWWFCTLAMLLIQPLPFSILISLCILKMVNELLLLGMIMRICKWRYLREWGWGQRFPCSGCGDGDDYYIPHPAEISILWINICILFCR